MPTRAFTSTIPGPLTLDLRQNSGEIAITVDRTAKHAHVKVSTKATEGAAAEAVEQAEFTESGSRLKVHVPIKGGRGGGVVITGGSNSYVSMGSVSGRVIINGVDVTAAVNAGSGGTVRTEVTIPPDCDVLLDSKAADARIDGGVKSLDYTGSSGNLRAERVGDLDLGLSSGNANISAVTGRLNAVISSGKLRVGAYAGSDGQVVVSSGSADINATSASSGRFSMAVSSGSAHLTGAGHLDVRKRKSSGSIHVS